MDELIDMMVFYQDQQKNCRRQICRQIKDRENDTKIDTCKDIDTKINIKIDKS